MPTTTATGADWGAAIVTSVTAALAMFMETIPRSSASLSSYSSAGSSGPR
jgi:hypothetical protein